jgi:hypothetical protein
MADEPVMSLRFSPEEIEELFSDEGTLTPRISHDHVAQRLKERWETAQAAESIWAESELPR